MSDRKYTNARYKQLIEDHARVLEMNKMIDDQAIKTENTVTKFFRSDTITTLSNVNLWGIGYGFNDTLSIRGSSNSIQDQIDRIDELINDLESRKKELIEVVENDK